MSMNSEATSEGFVKVGQPSSVEDKNAIMIGGAAPAALPTKETEDTQSMDAISFKPNDIVVLQGLGNASLNGQRAVILNSKGSAQPDRCQIKVISTSQKLSMKHDKMR